MKGENVVRTSRTTRSARRTPSMRTAKLYPSFDKAKERGVLKGEATVCLLREDAV